MNRSLFHPLLEFSDVLEEDNYIKRLHCKLLIVEISLSFPNFETEIFQPLTRFWGIFPCLVLEDFSMTYYLIISMHQCKLKS